MRAVVYRKPFDVAVEEVPDPRIEQPDDVIVRITSTCISRSDLDLYEGRRGAEPGIVLGQENLGIVEEVGAGVTALEQGDRVVMSAKVTCGFCRNCQAGFTGFCLTVNRWGSVGARSHIGMRSCPGGQAEYLRVPYADCNCLPLPAGTEHESDFVLLADVFPTGYHGCQLAGVSAGETVAVYGAGPVGLMAAYSALLRGASRVFVVDRVPERLAKVREIGAVAVDASEGDPVQQIKDQTGGGGTDKGVDAVGYRGMAPGGDREEPATVLNQLVQTVRPTGALGVLGLYVSSDPGGVDDNARHGMLLVAIGTLFEKGLRLGTGPTNVKRYDRRLRDMITDGRARPSFVVSQELSLEDAPAAYQKLHQRVDGYMKVILKPEAATCSPTAAGRREAPWLPGSRPDG